MKSPNDMLYTAYGQYNDYMIYKRFKLEKVYGSQQEKQNKNYDNKKT